MNLGKSWDDMAAEERAIFVSHLMYEPQREKLSPERPMMTTDEFAAWMEFAQRRREWIARAEEWLEREAIKRSDEAAERNRTEWRRIP